MTMSKNYNKDVDYLAHYRKKDGKQQSVTEHLLETAALAKAHASEIGMPCAGELAGISHDGGKQRQRFLKYIREQIGLDNVDPDSDDVDQRGDVDHSSAGAQIVYNKIPQNTHDGRLIAQIIALSICSHHSGLVDCLTYDGMNNFRRKMQKSEEHTGTQEAWNNLPLDIRKRIDELTSGPELINEAKTVFNKLNIGIDGEKETNQNIAFKQGLLVRFLYSCLIDADRENTADFEFESNKEYRSGQAIPDWAELSLKMENHLKSLNTEGEVNRQRKLVSDACFISASKPRGFFRLTVPTGGGKTLSSLRFGLNHANHHKHDDYPIRRIIYILPFTTIIEQNAEEVRKILAPNTECTKSSNKKPIVLEHHSNILPERENAWSKLVSENWDSPVVFTTMVQFLESAFGSGTKSARRFHTLANAILIFDEIQAIPLRCVHMFNLLVRFLAEVCGSTIVLCTATQPSLGQVEVSSRRLPVNERHEMYEDRNTLFNALKRVEIIFEKKPKTIEEIGKLSLTNVDEFGSSLVVVNRKDTARELYLQLKDTPKTKVFHLTTGMCAAHRYKVLSEIRSLLKPESGERVICISTNLIEAGVNISFGSAIRLKAGLDSIAQTAGRVNRHGEMNRLGRVTVVKLYNENLAHLHHIEKGSNATDYVHTKIQKNPGGFPNTYMGIEAQKLYSDYIFMNDKNLDYKVSKKSPIERNDNLFTMLSDNGIAVKLYKNENSNKYPDMPLCQSFATASGIFQAIDSYTRGALTPHGRGKEIIADLGAKSTEIKHQYELLREAQRYTVNIPMYKMEEYEKCGIIYEVNSDLGIYALSENTYHEDIGFCIDYYSLSEDFIQ